VLGAASFADFKQEVEQMQTRLKEAQARFLQAQADQSEAGQEAARKEIQQIQADQLASLRRLTATSQAQMNALQQIKGAGH
jgi:type II secretory pathway predicted ATPase ExeA